MKGLEITYRGETIKATTKDGIVHFILFVNTCHEEHENILDIRGSEDDMSVKWLQSNPKQGDEIKVKIVDIDEPSEPISKTPNDQKKEDILKEQLERYQELKKELEGKGLL